MADLKTKRYSLACIPDTSDPKARKFVGFDDGDIVVCAPAGHKWGKKEKQLFTLCQIDLSDEQAKVLAQPLKGEAEMTLVPQEDKDGKILEPTIEMVEPVLADRRYKIDLQEAAAKSVIPQTALIDKAALLEAEKVTK